MNNKIIIPDYPDFRYAEEKILPTFSLRWPAPEKPKPRWEMSLDTMMRKKHDDGFWYKVHVRTVLSCEEHQKQEAMVDMFKMFTQNLYKFQVLGKINPELKTSDGWKVYPKDKNQQDEDERLIYKC